MVDTEKEFIEFFKDTTESEDIKTLLAMVDTDSDYFGCTWDITEIWDTVMAYGLLYKNPKMGWIDRKGKVYGCDCAAHDIVIHDVLKLTVAEVEAEGWVRVGLYGKYVCRKKMTRAQEKSLDKMLLLWSNSKDDFKAIG